MLIATPLRWSKDLQNTLQTHNNNNNKNNDNNMHYVWYVKYDSQFVYAAYLPIPIYMNVLEVSVRKYIYVHTLGALC